MRNVVLSLIVFTLCASASASAETQPVNKTTFFLTERACTTALASGEYTVYVAKFFGKKDENPVNGKDKQAFPLEANACVKMDTTAGKLFVVQETGTKFRWLMNEDGSVKAVYARDDCGNKVYAIAYLQSTVIPSPTITPTPMPKVIETPPPTIPGPDGIGGLKDPPTTTPSPEKTWTTAMTGTVEGFTSGGTRFTQGTAAPNAICWYGNGASLGMEWTKGGLSPRLGISLAGKFLNAGSQSYFPCGNCGETQVAYANSRVGAVGLEASVTQPLPIFRENTSVYPIVILRGGALYTLQNKDFFGADVLFYGALGGGLEVKITDRLDLRASAEISTPGLIGGRVSFVYKP